MIVIPAKRMNAHRVSYLIHKGDIPEEMVILHSCDNPACVNPDHLSIGTQKENMQDMIKKGRQNFGHFRKLTPDQMKSIRQEYIPGKVTHEFLAKKYSVTRTNISYIVRGKSWKDFPEGTNPIDQRRSLTLDQIKEIQSLKGKGTLREIAKQFNVGHSTIKRQWDKLLTS